ncbi:MAG: threonine synthase [Lewinella sp.]
MTLYQSTLGQAPPVDFETAVLQGLAPDGGMYVPTLLPHVSQQQLKDWKNLSYPDLAHEVLSLFIGEETMPAVDLRKLIDASFSTFSHSEVIPHHALTDDCYVQELFHGPTLSFKDVAMGFVVNLFDYFLRRRGERRTLMVATSGDTGPAAAHASIGKTSISTWLFFPTGLITEEQVRQMTTIMAPNVHPVTVNNCKNGSDDLDGLIGACFADADFREEMQLSSVNSINWARVMTQTVHYFYGYLRHAERVGDPVNFSVPCGAFGNMCAGSMARRMGLPVGEMIVANNANTTLSEVLTTGTFSKPDIKNTLASAIDISVPMNFWRHLYFSLNGNTDRLRSAWEIYDRNGSVQFSDTELATFREGFLTYTVTDDNILATTHSHWEEENYLLDPHGAVAVAAARHYRPQLSGPIICLATAHPAKFPETIRLAVGGLPVEGKHASLEAARTAGERKYEFDHATMLQAVPKVMRAVMANKR